MLRKLLVGSLEILAQRVSKIGCFERRPRLHGEADRAAKAIVLGETMDCSVVVFVRDVDKQGGAKRSVIEGRRKLRDMHEQIEEGFAAANAPGIVTLKATPYRMLETWALADSRALKAVGANARHTASLPTKLEETWGNEKDPTSGHPKCLLRVVLQRDATATDFEDIARESTPTSVASRCPESFQRFLHEVSSARKRLRAI